MDIAGEHRIPAPRERVWSALNDPEVLRSCIPGCEEVTRVSEQEFAARVTSRIGAIKASFSGRVQLSDLDPPNGYTITGRGEGGAAGFAKGTARVTLAEDGPEATLLAYTARADVGGKLASLGSRLIQGVAARTADDFFACFTRHMAGGSMAAQPAPSRGNTAQDTRQGVTGHPTAGAVHLGPAQAPLKPQQVPPQPTVPYSLGLGATAQNRVLAIGIVLWLLIMLLLYAM